MNHPIFQAPNKVSLTVAPRATPAAYAGHSLGPTMLMWRVQTEGYQGGTSQLVGIVSSYAGFLDSPDTEWISGGVNTKKPKAVALGRHGNFFHWGFAASPSYLTDEAKLVFINAVHYIAKFDHQAPIARKRKGTSTRARVRATLQRISEAGYAEAKARHARFVAEDAKRRASIRDRIAAGQQVSKMDRELLKRPTMPEPGRFASARRLFSAARWAEVADNEAKIRAALEADLPFLRPVRYYELEVDEELQKFGVGNNDIKLLDKAVAALKGSEADLAERLLRRYTEAPCKTPTEWAEWLKTNRDRLFYSEAAGFKWLVNTLDSRGAGPAPADPAEALGHPGPPFVTPAHPKKPSKDHPVVATMRIATLDNGRHQVRVRAEILKGWHAYKAVGTNSPYVAMDVQLRLPPGLKRHGDWSKPRGRRYPADPKLLVLKGAVEFRCELTGPLPKDLSKMRGVLEFQVCNDRMCLPPDTLQLKAAPR